MDDETKQALNNITTVMQQRFTNMHEMLDRRFKAIDERFKSLEGRFDALKKETQNGFEHLDGKIEGISVKMEFLDEIRKSMGK